MSTTYAGDHVELQAPPELIEFYKRTALKCIADDDTLVDRVFAWLHTFPDSNLTGGQHVCPLLAHVRPLLTESVAPAPLNHFALLACIIMARHNQEEWLHSRMTFQALADIQEARHSVSALSEFCTLLDSLAQLIPLKDA